MPRKERPLDENDENPVVRLAVDLRRLRCKAGNPTYQVLAGRAHYSVPTLATAASGTKLPSLAVTVAYVRACGGDVDEWEQRWHAVAAELNAAAKPAKTVEDAGFPVPYAGLAAFQPQDADRFFGREALTGDLVRRVCQRGFLAVFGASGVGKSSLLRAGLIPGFHRRAADEGSAAGLALLMAPGDHPVAECAVQLAALTGGSAAVVRAELENDPAHLHLRIRQHLVKTGEDADVLLVVDQFEEVFTLCRSDDERDRFIAMLLHATKEKASRTRVVLGVRADFYTHCARHPRLAEELAGAQFLVGPMKTDDLRRAVVQPATGVSCQVEGALIAAVIADAAGQAGALPLVSHALLQTWRRRRGSTLSLSGYQAAGGIAHALAQTAETTFTELSPVQQRAARELFIRLTALGEGTEDTKRRLRRGELDLPDSDLETVLDKLSAARLIVLDHDAVEIAHEALIRAWPRLRGWLDADRDGLRLHRRLAHDASDWADLGRDPGALYRGLRLAAACDCADSTGVRLTALEQEFLDASRVAEAREHARWRRRTRQLRGLAASLAVLLVVAAAIATTAVRQREHTLAQERAATSRQLAAEAQAQARLDTAVAIRKSLDAYQTQPTAEARSAILSLASKRPYHALLPSPPKTTFEVAFSPDGRWLAAPGEARRLTLWDVPARRRTAVFAAPLDQVTAVRFSANGQRLAVGTFDGHVHIWDLLSRRITASLTAADTDTPIATLRFSPDGRLLVSADQHNAVKLWDTSGKTAPVTLAAKHDSPEPVSRAAVAVSPDGALLAFTDTTGAVALWDLRTATRAGMLPAAGAWTNSADFTSDGHTLATTSRSAPGIRLWDVSSRREVADLAGDPDPQLSVVADHANAQLLTVNTQGTVNVWDIGRRTLLATLVKDLSMPASVAVSSDGRTIAGVVDNGIALWDRARLPLMGGTGHSIYLDVSDSGGTVVASGGGSPTVVWDIKTQRSRVIAAPANSDDAGGLSILSPDGKFVAVNDKGRIALHDARTAAVVAEIPRPADRLHARSFDFSRDSRTLAIATRDNGGIWFYDLATRQYVRKVAEGIDVGNTHYSPDGRMFAYISEGTTITILNTDDYTLVKKLTVVDEARGSDWPVYRFSRDGSLLLSTNPQLTASGKITVWNTATFAVAAEFPTPATEARSPYFSPDHRYIATFGNNDIVTVWETATGTRWATLTGHTGRISRIRWSPTGVLASSSDDNTVILWDTNLDDAIRRLCDSISHDFPGAGPAPEICNASSPSGRN